MEMEKVSKRNCPATSWSGGTTTQLAIWPSDASYTDRNFEWRISTASVDVPESDFTLLPGYQRILMVLKGSLQMIHQTPDGERTVALNQFEQSSFDGSWPTTGRGEVVDFNIMTADGWNASLELYNDSDVVLELAVSDIGFLWVVEGELRLDTHLVAANEGMAISGPKTVTGQIRDNGIILIVRLQKREA